MVHCDDALDDFCARHWPCERASRAGRCVNCRSGHSSKGHQLKNGKVFAGGGYQSDFSADSFGDEWRSLIHNNLKHLQERLEDEYKSCESEEQAASNIHRSTVLVNFYQHVGPSKAYISHSVCFSCLIAPPSHPLPCGHVLCTPCLQAYGKPRGKNLVEVGSCPLHLDEGEWSPPCLISFKPPLAGVRILTLDG